MIQSLATYLLYIESLQARCMYRSLEFDFNFLNAKLKFSRKNQAHQGV